MLGKQHGHTARRLTILSSFRETIFERACCSLFHQPRPISPQYTTPNKKKTRIRKRTALLTHRNEQRKAGRPFTTHFRTPALLGNKHKGKRVPHEATKYAFRQGGNDHNGEGNNKKRERKRSGRRRSTLRGLVKRRRRHGGRNGRA